MKKIISLLLGISVVFGSVSACAAEEDDILKVTPVISGSTLSYSVQTDLDMNDALLLSALYDEGVLSAVKINASDGEFEMKSGRSYKLKIFAWKKENLEPLCDAVSFDNLTANNTPAPSTEPVENPPLPGDEIQEIPNEYYTAAQNKGTLKELYYDTYESFTYEQKSQRLTKRAIVYLPYNYDENEEYNIFYLMHGGWSNETTTLGTPDRPSSFKNVIDNAIEDGKIKPLIIVCPTYNNTNENGQDSDDFSLAMQLNRQFHNELLNDLIPAVEGKYSTYAENTAPDGIAASRDHRGFGGFSMGSVATWRTFEHCLDYFRYFLPMSCGTSLDDENIFAAAQGHNQEDYFVWVMTGTDDFAYSYDNSRVNKMRSSEYFTENENFIYRVKDGYSHGGQAANEYTYNGLMWFWSNISDESGEDSDTPVDFEPFTHDTKISDVMSDPAFGDYGRLIFPVNTGYWSGDTLEDLRLTWYNYINPDKTVEIVNYMKENALKGNTIFYDIYSDAEKAADSAKRDTGLFFFRGDKNAKTAICNAGGGFSYVGAMHDSFPHALELSKMGYNAFALIYRPGWDTAMEDLARAIAFIHDHAAELEIDVEDYSLWGGSAGARMAADLGSYGTEYYGEAEYPKAGAVIMQYTGHSEVTGNEPPTYNCVGTSDGIASYRTMENRIGRIKANGTDAMIEVFDGLPHGFGLGQGTVAEGWINNAVAFWERNMK